MSGGFMWSRAAYQSNARSEVGNGAGSFNFFHLDKPSQIFLYLFHVHCQSISRQ